MILSVSFILCFIGIYLNIPPTFGNDDDNNNDNNELELVEEINSENSFVGVNIAEFDDDILFY